MLESQISRAQKIPCCINFYSLYSACFSGIGSEEPEWLCTAEKSSEQPFLETLSSFCENVSSGRILTTTLQSFFTRCGSVTLQEESEHAPVFPEDCTCSGVCLDAKNPSSSTLGYLTPGPQTLQETVRNSQFCAAPGLLAN